jgi:hypothetical protein
MLERMDKVKFLLRVILIIFIILTIPNFCIAKPTIRIKPKMVHLLEREDKWIQEMADSLAINRRIKESAIEYADLGFIARFVNYDIAMPADSKEYIDLNKNAVLIIGALTHNKNELPLNKVYIKYMGEEIVLEKILSRISEIEDGIVKNVFGNYREDSFYLFPIHFLAKDCELVIDWAKNREGFILAEYPVNIDFDYIKEDENIDKQNL